MFDDLRQDLRYTLRNSLRSPAFALSAIGILGLGIGATTAIFTVVDGVLLRPLPYPHPDRIVWVREVAADGHGMNVADANYQDLRRQAGSFAALTEMSGAVPVSVSGGAEPVRTTFTAVSGDFFRVMGVDPARGRSFTPEEERQGAAPAVIVSWNLWRHVLDGGALAGKTLKFHGQLYSVVGVMPRGFDYPRGADLWIPAALFSRTSSRTAHNWRVVGRLADGATLGSARAELRAIAHRLQSAYGHDLDLVDVSATPLRDAMVGEVRAPLLVLLGASAFLLLIAVANVGNLLLARMTARQRELAVRRALGASRGRLLRQLLTESLVLGLGAGALGIVLAYAGTRALLAFGPSYLPRLSDVGVDGSVLLFALAVSLVTALGLGSAAALSGPGDLRGALASGQRTVTGSGGGRLARDALVVGQTALTLVLLAGAALMARSLLGLLSVQTGFRTHGLLVMNVAASSPEDPGLVRSFDERLMERLRRIPGVQAVGGISDFPLQDEGADGTYLVLDRPDEATTVEGLRALARQPGRTGSAWWRVASEDYFRAMGIPLLRGRGFSDQDAPDAPVDVALVSQSFAARKWRHGDALGKLIEYGNMDGDVRPLRIVGVVGDVRGRSMASGPQPTLYAYSRQRPTTAADFHVVLHTRGDPKALIPAAREVLHEVDPQVPPTFRTVGQIVGSSTSDRRFALLLLGAFGAAALLLAVGGIYAVVAYLASRRTREIGVRIAFGARPADVVRLLVGRSAILAGIGIALGIAAALAVTRLLEGLLYGVTATDPLAYVAGAAVLGISVLAASWLPARRAGRLDPASTLRLD
ncbi:MAG: ABC transporter permease [Candidatus Palauibacterales bacterium]|nr:ABC transporter permease [Candidatus Palauibacterales bacterium]MDP2528645.1 ABC transporter permease [Candidatus Palauibacterales bacterium]